ncbi:hypothetical protein B0O99DRAFT_631416 [Bisporella sp. PMI_857]|nr:hypothetical protein B0O99DRAFT_631416 [Bisporella sp. PMI_857]
MWCPLRTFSVYVWRAEIESIRAGVVCNAHTKQRPFQLESKTTSLRIRQNLFYSTCRLVTCALAGRQSVEYPLEQNFHSTHFYFEPQFDIEAILYNYIYLLFCGFHALRQGGLTSGHLVRAMTVLTTKKTTRISFGKETAGPAERGGYLQKKRRV